MKRQAKPTHLGYALLGLVHDKARSGYDLRKVFAETALGNYSSSPGAIYPALARLEKQGLVEGREDHTKRLRPKKLYRPTALGRRVFRAWLKAEISQDDVSRRLDELMLRFAFHATLDDDRATHAFLVALAEKLGAYVAVLETQAQKLQHKASRHARLALEAGIEQYRAAARWAQKALNQFE